LPSLPVSLATVVATHASAIWQLVPEYPALHPVHVQLPVVPPTVPPLMQYTRPLLPVSVLTLLATHASAVWQLVPE
jgi:hypothetical protein